MAVAAAVAGDSQEARFWHKLPGTFAKLRSLANPCQQVHPTHPSCTHNEVLSAGHLQVSGPFQRPFLSDVIVC